MKAQARQQARRTGDSDILETGARLGDAANGVVNLAMGWIALRLARGGGDEEEASAEGALRTVAEQPLGSVLLWVVLVGFGLLALWCLTEAVRRSETGERLKAAAKVVAYAGMAFITGTVATGGGSGSDGSVTAAVMAEPVGQVLIAAVGVGVAGVGGYFVVKGWRKKFLRDLREHPGPLMTLAGRAGYIGRGMAFLLLGGVVVAAAVTADAERAQGLDSALNELREAPYGVVLLAVVALGFVAYGIYSFARARFARV